MKTALLKDLAHAFAANRAVVSRAIREFQANDPEEFAKSASCVLKVCNDNPGTRFLLATLSTRPDFLQILCDPAVFTVAQSVALVRQAKAFDPRIEWKLANLFTSLCCGSDGATAFATHCMEVLSQLSEDVAALPALRELLQCPNCRVRSKAALLIGHITRNPQWAKLNDARRDCRVAANAVESVWGLDSPGAREVFREAAASHEPRAAVNGAVGLYLAREIEAIEWLFRYAREDAAAFRASAAWGMGRTGDPRFLSTLEALDRDADERVHKIASSAAAFLRKRLATLQEQPTIPLHMTEAAFDDSEHTLQVTLGGLVPGTRLDGLHFAITNGAEPVDQYLFRPLQPGGPYEFRFYAPQAYSPVVKVELFTDRGCGECTGFEVEGAEPRGSMAEILLQ